MSVTEEINQYIEGYTDWRRDILGQLRVLILSANPEITEDWKWSVPVFTHSGMVCATSAFKGHVKINFFKGSRLKDPKKLINNGFTSKDHRSIDYSEGDIINEPALKELVREAVKLNNTKN